MPPLTAQDITPTVEDVAVLVGPYTRRGIGGYGLRAGREETTFTDDTSPTREQVVAFIRLAATEVTGRADTLDTNDQALAKVAVTWHAAASVVASRPGAAEDDGLYRAFITNYRATLDSLSGAHIAGGSSAPWVE